MCVDLDLHDYFSVCMIVIFVVINKIPYTRFSHWKLDLGSAIQFIDRPTGFTVYILYDSVIFLKAVTQKKMFGRHNICFY